MTILISACEVGSVRAVLPVCHKLFSNNIDFLIDDFGTMRDELPIIFRRFLIKILETEIGLFYIENAISLVLFSPNIDKKPILLARYADSIGIKTFFLLDYWNGYVARMCLDGGEIFQPTKYLVPDEYAAQQAKEEGIKTSIIDVSGHPDMCIEKDVKSLSVDSYVKKILLKQKNKQVIIFVSEPVLKDQGSSLNENQNFRGYTEQDCLQLLLNAVKKCVLVSYILILPHPRQNVIELKKYWSSIGGNSFGTVTDSKNGRYFLRYADKVVGMASTLLYTAWLLEKSVATVQPGLINKSLHAIGDREGVTSVNSYADEPKLIEWLDTRTFPTRNEPRFEKMRHCSAASYICREIIKVVSRQPRTGSARV